METIDFNEVIRDNIEVVGGLLKPFTNKGRIEPGTDLNTIMDPGLYILNGSYINAPFSQSWGFMIVLASGGSSPTQIITESTSQFFNCFIRNDIMNEWFQLELSKII